MGHLGHEAQLEQQVIWNVRPAVTCSGGFRESSARIAHVRSHYIIPLSSESVDAESLLTDNKRSIVLEIKCNLLR